MQKSYVVTGTLTDGQTVTLDESVPVPGERVRLTIEPISLHAGTSYRETMAAIRERQKARGHRPPSRSEIDARVEDERDSWTD